VSITNPILSRLDTGRPLLVSGDPAASLRARGVELQGPTSIGRLLRERPGVVREHYHQEILAGVDVLSCLTADTIPRALQRIGMPFRSAALTGNAVELAIEAADAAPRPVIVAGVLGNTEVPPVAHDRLADELATHAARLATAGCELILALGFGSHQRAARHAALVASATTKLPTWAIAALSPAGFTVEGIPADEVAQAAFEDGAQVVVLEIESADLGLGYLDRLLAVSTTASSRRGPEGVSARRHLGFSLASGDLDPEAWAVEARRLIDAGVRVVGGGPGTTHRHLSALSSLLRGTDRQSLWPRAV
jgi:5-methyltetrahydrofolate--homocysteine methyltransferase